MCAQYFGLGVYSFFFSKKIFFIDRTTQFQLARNGKKFVMKLHKNKIVLTSGEPFTYDDQCVQILILPHL